MIRTANIKDLESIVEIYNQAIDAGFQTAYTERLRAADRVGWFNDHPESSFPLLVYEQAGSVAGWLSVTPYRPDRGALRYAVEVSYFVHEDSRGIGIGSQLLAAGLERCWKLGYKTLLAILMEPNVASAKLLEKYGFEKWAYLPAVADFDGVECSQVYYGLKM